MELDYKEIGKRIARRRKELGLKQAQVSEMVGISDPYMSNIERAISIPSIEVIMRLAIALDTTPDTFLVGTMTYQGEKWQQVAARLQNLTAKQLDLTDHFITWVAGETL